MKTKDLLTIATTALGTATLTVVFLASPLMTGTDATPLGGTIAKPKLVANDIEMTLSAANGQVFKAGDQPTFELQAVNTINEPSEAVITAIMQAQSPLSEMSRVVRMPTPLWREQIKLALQPNETKVLTLATQTNLPANSSVFVILSQEGQDGQAPPVANRPIVAMIFSTAPPAAAPAKSVAAARQIAEQ